MLCVSQWSRQCLRYCLCLEMDVGWTTRRAHSTTPVTPCLRRTLSRRRRFPVSWHGITDKVGRAASSFIRCCSSCVTTRLSKRSRWSTGPSSTHDRRFGWSVMSATQDEVVQRDTTSGDAWHIASSLLTGELASTCRCSAFLRMPAPMTCSISATLPRSRRSRDVWASSSICTEDDRGRPWCFRLRNSHLCITGGRSCVGR